MTSFNLDDRIEKFNKMYGLSCPGAPTMPPTRADAVTNLRNFYTILAEELDEVEELIVKLQDGITTQPEILSEIADWLGDIMIYCASEMTKYGLEPSAVLDTIMASNMSKLDMNGNPIYDERGKVMKGPNYWKPEPQLQRYIVAAARQAAKEKQDGK